LNKNKKKSNVAEEKFQRRSSGIRDRGRETITCEAAALDLKRPRAIISPEFLTPSPLHFTSRVLGTD
jgi:hypothetical protein